jgi:hypothetical protein
MSPLFYLLGALKVYSMFLFGVPWPAAKVDEVAPATSTVSLLGTRSTWRESIDLRGRVGAFQCKLRSGRGAATSSCIKEKTPDGSWYSTAMCKYHGIQVTGVSYPWLWSLIAHIAGCCPQSLCWTALSYEFLNLPILPDTFGRHAKLGHIVFGRP